MKKLLITGTSGFLGKRIANYYQEKYDVYTPSHKELDITSQQSVTSVLGAYHPDVVIHCAAISDVGKCEREPEKAQKINVDGTLNMVREAGAIHAKCIVCSSDQVYVGSSVMEPHREDEVLAPSNVYGRGKLEAEQAGLEINSDAIFLRLTWMYDSKTLSKTEHGDFLRTLMVQLKTEKTLRYAIHDKRGLTDAQEVVQNMERLFEVPGSVYNYGSPNEKNPYELMQSVFTQLGFDSARIEKDEEAFKTCPRNLTMNLEKLHAFGIHFLSAQEALVKNLWQIQREK